MNASPVTTSGNAAPTKTGRPLGFRNFERFDDCAGLLAHLREITLSRVSAYGLNPSPIIMMGDVRAAATTVMASAPSSRVAEQAADGGKTTSSGTNTQEVGVDEGDVAENDGRYVYTITNGAELRIIDVESARQTALLALSDPGQHQMILDGDRLVIVTSTWGRFGLADTRFPIAPNDQTTKVTVVDVTVRSTPKITSTSTLDGSVLAVRSSAGVVRVVMASRLGDRLDFVQPARPGTDTEAKAKKINIDAIKSSSIGDWLPRTATGSGDPAQALDCSQVGHPAEYAGLGLTWVASIDVLKGSKVSGSAGVVAEGSTVYASESRLFVSTTRWNDQNDPDVRPVRPEPPRTGIHSFSLDGAKAAYEATGNVPGTLLNQFSMSEYHDVLRVATTEQTSAGGASTSSSVFTLQRTGGEWRMAGKVTGLGRNESIYAVRFLGDQGYVVTFRRTDPLYVLDLHDPAAPKLTGELKIPGFSAYLHPLASGRLLGLGEDASDTGRVSGAQLSLFDVSDATAPKRLSALALSSYGGEAEYDHHAFLYWEPTGQVVIPTDQVQGGAVVAKVSANGTVTEQGRVLLADNANGDVVRRSMVVGERLVLLGNTTLGIFRLDSLQAAGKLSLL